MADQVERLERSEGIALDRLVFFSDGVIAIAITLLALDLRLPESHGIANRELAAMLLAMLPRYIAFALSFVVIGAYWRAHHAMFRFIHRFDAALLVRNLIFLFFVVQLPFLTSVLGAHGDLFTAIALYGAGMACMGLSSVWIWSYAASHGMVAGVTPLQVRDFTWRALVVPIVFLLSIPIAFARPQAAALSWFAIIPVQWLLRRRERAHSL